jgi:hypothetical protein
VADALAGVILFLLGYLFCKYRDLPRGDTKEETCPPEEETAEIKQQKEQLQAFHTMMNYDESTAYGGMSDEQD